MDSVSSSKKSAKESKTKNASAAKPMLQTQLQIQQAALEILSAHIRLCRNINARLCRIEESIAIISQSSSNLPTSSHHVPHPLTPFSPSSRFPLTATSATPSSHVALVLYETLLNSHRNAVSSAAEFVYTQSYKMLLKKSLLHPRLKRLFHAWWRKLGVWFVFKMVLSWWSGGAQQKRWMYTL
jgi:hypothetical protein